MRTRSGFALLAVLWVLTGATALATVALLLARDAFATSRNRTYLLQASWAAQTCVALTRAAVANVLLERPRHEPLPVLWTALDTLSASASPLLGSRCEVAFRAQGNTLDLNDATEVQLRALLTAVGLRDPTALSDALLDWRDRDDIPRPMGAESDWYAAAGRPLPRNGPLADMSELCLVRGFEDLDLRDFLGVDSARISLNTAPVPVLLTVPGISLEAANRISEMRGRRGPLTDFAELLALLSPSSRDSLLTHYQEVARLTTFEPDGWLVTVTAHAGSPAVRWTVELRLSRVGARAAVVRWREW